MNKSDLVKAIAENSGLSQTDAQTATNAFIAEVQNALRQNQKVAIPGFGTWSVSARAARTGRNPQTGQEISIAAKNVVKFKAGKELDDAVNS